MAGLLGDSMDDPGIQGLLSLGFGLMNSRGNFGQALGQAGPQALDQYNQASQMLQRRKLLDQETQSRAQQMEMAQQQLAEFRRNSAEAEAQRGRDDQFRQMIPAPTGGPATSGPTEFGNFSLPGAPADPHASMLFQALQQKQIKPMEYLSATQKDRTPIKLGAGESLFEPGTFKPLATNPKESEQPSAVKEYAFAKGQGYPGTFQQFVLEQKKAGASNVSVSMDKGFGDAFAKDAASSLATSRDQARAAASNIQTFDRINSILDTGKVALGPTAKFETFGRQLGETIGIGGKDNAEKLSNTRKLILNAASLAVDGAAALKGQGQITEGERALIMRASGGDVDSMTAPEVRALTGALRKVNAAKIAQHQAQLKNVGPQFSKFVPFYNVDAPAEPTSIDSLLKKYGAN